MRITERRWRTSIYHFIDVKGLADDSFDNSFTAVCRYKLRRKHIADTVDGEIVEARRLLIEYYQTEFSKGKNLYLIAKKGDTVFYREEMDWIR